ncbi:MAG: hypothetical protein CVV07_01210 [Gammaproteobacteria bacterium HGW-Gammaproteobacteria-11]|nr:MAG: hypothetical protein CVV07_01210 [Gammaproteobacteria bacterium HGW-Gammaproteobacteria-11]
MKANNINPDVTEAVDQALEVFTTASVHNVLRERIRQIQEEGYTAEQDDLSLNIALAEAAGCYALAHRMETTVSGIQMKTSAFHRLWPWAPAEFKKRDQRRNWVIAAALLLAAIDQYDRAHSTTTQEDDHVDAE